MHRWIALSLVVTLASCVPQTQQNPQSLAADTADEAAFQTLVAPFRDELSELGVTLLSHQAYRYEGEDPNAFIQAINAFYQTYPGFCPLAENAFFADEEGLQFLTLASNNNYQVRGFLYDQSRRPRLTYAYFEASSGRNLPAIVCETAAPQQ